VFNAFILTDEVYFLTSPPVSKRRKSHSHRRPSLPCSSMPSRHPYVCNWNVSKAERFSRSLPISSPLASQALAKVMPSVPWPMNWPSRGTRSCGRPPRHWCNACSLLSVTCACLRSWRNWIATLVSSSTTSAMCSRIARRWKSFSPILDMMELESYRARTAQLRQQEEGGELTE
jgi:hypothetical protein